MLLCHPEKPLPSVMKSLKMSGIRHTVLIILALSKLVVKWSVNEHGVFSSSFSARAACHVRHAMLCCRQEDDPVASKSSHAFTGPADRSGHGGREYINDHFKQVSPCLICCTADQCNKGLITKSLIVHCCDALSCALHACFAFLTQHSYKI